MNWFKVNFNLHSELASQVQSGDVLWNCAYPQDVMHTPVFQGLSRLRIMLGGNYTNCDLPADTQIDSVIMPNTAQIEPEEVI